MNVKKCNLFVGLNDKDTKKQEKTTEQAKKEILQQLYYAGIEGATLVDVVGVWNNEREKTIQVILFEVESQKVERFCQGIKQALNQQAVAVEYVQNVDIKFM